MTQNTETAVSPPTVEQSAPTAAARRMRNQRERRRLGLRCFTVQVFEKKVDARRALIPHTQLPLGNSSFILFLFDSIRSLDPKALKLRSFLIMPPGRPKGAKNHKTLEREKAKKIATARAELATNAEPIDLAASLDSLWIMEQVMAHFFRRAMVEQRLGAQADWNAVDSLMQKALAAAEKVARYRHAQLSAVRLAGDISGKMDDVSLDELLVTIKQEWAKLGPLIGLDPNQLLLLQGARIDRQ